MTVAGRPVQTLAEFPTCDLKFVLSEAFWWDVTFQSVVLGPALSHGTGTTPAQMRCRTGHQQVAELHLHRGLNVHVCNTRRDIPWLKL